MSQPEKRIENMILHYLKSKRIFAWKTQTVGIYDQKLGRFRKAGALYTRGVADIIGIYNSRLLAIEVKSARGVLSEHQKIFLQNVKEHGGIAMVARSVEEVEEKLKHWSVA
jgi:penicillin-binding protein-related factor A (putative recombinase)